MAERTNIEWTDATFNPWIGCQAVSAACDHCYAETLVKRWGGDFATRRITAPDNWKKPLLWNRQAEVAGVRRRVFCASLADVFDNQVPTEWRDDLWALIRVTPWLDWQLLTKRPQNIAKMLPSDWGNGYPHVWLGATAENQTEADRCIPHLLGVPAAKRFLSCEPLLSPIDLTPIADDIYQMLSEWYGPNGFDPSGSQPRVTRRRGYFPRIDWVIAGGESGPGARPMHPDWVRSLRDQCAAADVPFFFKQWGEWLDAESEAFQQLAVSHRRFEAMGEYEDPINGCYRVGKKAASNLLDGMQHKAVPA